MWLKNNAFLTISFFTDCRLASSYISQGNSLKNEFYSLILLIFYYYELLNTSCMHILEKILLAMAWEEITCVFQMTKLICQKYLKSALVMNIWSCICVIGTNSQSLLYMFFPDECLHRCAWIYMPKPCFFACFTNFYRLVFQCYQPNYYSM